MNDPNSSLSPATEGRGIATVRFSTDVLRLDSAEEVSRIRQAIRNQVLRTLRRRGAVVGLSGGIDSSVTAALCVEAFGADKLLAIFMPEKDSGGDSLRLGQLVAEKLRVHTVTENIEPLLTAAGCYARRDECIRELVPEFGRGWGCKVVNTYRNGGYNIALLVVQSPDGRSQSLRLPLELYLGIIAATNMKQRSRKNIEYYHADRLNYAVAGTPNRLEYDQGFFVKNGDGAADFKPIAHLYKTQVYQLAEYLGIPEEIRARTPTTDTWPMEQTQEEFFFSLPYDVLDLCLYAYNHAIPAEVVAPAVGLKVEQVAQVWQDIAAKRRATSYLHHPPLLVEPVFRADVHAWQHSIRIA